MTFENPNTVLSYAERRQLNRAHAQGFNHDPIVEEHRKEEEAEFLERIKKAGEKIVTELARLDEEVKKLEQKVIDYDKNPDKNHPIVVLRERAALLKSTSEALGRQIPQLQNEIDKTHDEVVQSRAQKEQLTALIQHMKSQLKNKTEVERAIASGMPAFGSAVSMNIAFGGQKGSSKPNKGIKV